MNGFTPHNRSFPLPAYKVANLGWQPVSHLAIDARPQEFEEQDYTRVSGMIPCLFSTYGQIRNWNEYNASLNHRGRLTAWVSSEAIANWTTDELTGEPGATLHYFRPSA